MLDKTDSDLWWYENGVVIWWYENFCFSFYYQWFVWILDFLKGIMDFDVKLKVDVAFSDEGMMLVLDMKPCEKERKDEEKKKKWKMKKTRLDPA